MPPSIIDATEKLLLQNVLDGIAGLPDALRQTLADHLWAQIPVPITESQYVAALVAGTTIQLTPQTGGLEVISSIVAVVAASATGLVQLGALQIPVSAGLTVITPVNLPLFTNDLRSLTIAGATGPALLWLTGEQRPTYGVLAK